MGIYIYLLILKENNRINKIPKWLPVGKGRHMCVWGWEEELGFPESTLFGRFDVEPCKYLPVYKARLNQNFEKGSP